MYYALWTENMWGGLAPWALGGTGSRGYKRLLRTAQRKNALARRAGMAWRFFIMKVDKHGNPRKDLEPHHRPSEAM